MVLSSLLSVHVIAGSYRGGVPAGGFYHECLNTDSEHYGGSNAGNLTGIEAAAAPMHGHRFSLSLSLPPLSTLMLQPAHGKLGV